MSKGKEYITTDDLIEMLSEVKKDELELIRITSSLTELYEILMQLNGKLDLFEYQFHFLGLGTKEELKATLEKIMNEIQDEVRKKLICQI